MPHKPDLFYIGLEEFTSEPTVETLNAKTSEDVHKVVKKDNGAPIIKDWKSDNKNESVPQPKIEKKTVKPSVAKVEFVKPKQQSQNARKTIKNVKKTMQSNNSKRGNQRSWNYMISQRLGSNFEMYNKVYYECGSFDHLKKECNYHQRKFQNHKIQVSDGLGPQKMLIFLPHVHGNLQMDLQEKGVIDSGCSRRITGNMSYLTDYEEINGGYVAFG
nr:Gag-Pol polyprotein [Tanacetum cinerariifolium]